MKKRITLLLLIGFIIVSCSKEEIDTSFTLDKMTIEGKWIVNNSNEYDFIEFTKDNVFFIKRKIIDTNPDFSNFSFYEIINDQIIGIANLGAIKVNSLTSSKMDFILELSDATQLNLTADRAAPISNSNTTTFISKIWQIESINGTNNENGFLIFSKSGTFFELTFASGIKFGTWKWCNSGETKIAISDDTPSLDCNSNQVIESIVLTEISFTGTDQRKGTSDTLIMTTE